jgi:hypothetical protein
MKDPKETAAKGGRRDKGSPSGPKHKPPEPPRLELRAKEKMEKRNDAAVIILYVCISARVCTLCGGVVWCGWGGKVVA